MATETIALVRKIAEYTIAIEFILIVLIIISTYFLKFYYFFKGKIKQKKSLKIKRCFVHLIQHNLDYTSSLFKPSWKKIDILVPIVHKLDVKYKSSIWHRIKMEFCKTTLLPLARKEATKKNWVSQFYAAEAFAILSEKDDENIILQLLNNATLMVFYSAIRSAIMNKSESCLKALIKRMCRENWLTKSMFLQAFEGAPTITRFMIERQLMHSQDPQVRSTCYNILLLYPMAKLRWDMKEDLNSKNTNLKLSAIKYISHVSKKAAIPILIKLLEDKEWEIRTVSLRLLGDLLAINVISSISKCLNDPEWWVRLAAAQTLKKFGNEGIAVLETQDIKMHPDAYRVAKYVLNKL